MMLLVTMHIAYAGEKPHLNRKPIPRKTIIHTETKPVFHTYEPKQPTLSDIEYLQKINPKSGGVADHDPELNIASQEKWDADFNIKPENRPYDLQDRLNRDPQNAWFFGIGFQYNIPKNK
jgi:hypothetical protein